MSASPFELNGFEPVRLIGEGGFGTVWLARQLNIQREVAFKVGHAPITDTTIQLRFERECIALGRLSGHPNIIDVFTAGLLDDGRPYIVLEYIDGGTLWDRFQTAPLPESELRKIGSQIAGALEMAHGAGVLHRDLKPENILLRKNGDAVLGDFGIARLHDGAQTTTHSITASIAYAAPEILSGQEPSVATDLYGIGVCLLGAAIREVPFVEDNDESIHPIVNRVLNEPPPALQSTGYSAHLLEIIHNLLEKTPGNRPRSAAVLKSQLEAVPAIDQRPESAATKAEPDQAQQAEATPATERLLPPLPPTESQPEPSPATMVAPSVTSEVQAFSGDASPPTPGAAPPTTAASPPSAPPPSAQPVSAPAPGAGSPPTSSAARAMPPALQRRRRIGAVAAAIVGVLAVVGGFVVFSGGGDDEPVEPRPLDIPLAADDLDFDTTFSAVPDSKGLDDVQFCGTAPPTTGLTDWAGLALASSGGTPNVFQKLARFESQADASTYVEAYVSTFDCSDEAPNSSELTVSVIPEATAPTSRGDETEAITFELVAADASSEVTIHGRVVVVRDDTDVFILMIISSDDQDLDSVDSLVDVAAGRLELS